MNRRLTRGLLAVWVGLLAGALPCSLTFAQQEQTIQGEIVDPAAYLKSGNHGPDVVNQTYEAIDGGQTLALLDEQSGALYLLLAQEPGDDPNELVYDYVNQQLTVTGAVYERNGVRGIVVKSVVPVEAAGTPPTTTTAPTAAPATAASAASRASGESTAQ